MDNPSNHVTDMEARLASAQGETLRLAIVKELEHLEASYRQLAATGLSRSELSLCLAVADAAASAITLLAQYPVCTDLPSAARFLH